jgi:lipopolysaccharide/colanic/teichoic acid biosynthesis glycosyltransferase
VFPSIQLERVPATVVSRPFAEVAERAAGLFLLVLSGPLLVTSALAASALSRRSPFVAHLRVGRNNRPFWMLKLRTMWERQGSTARHPSWIEYVIADPAEDGKQPCDARVSSRFAAFCRRHSIDELPQFWHVVRGEMSVVGPRPLTRAELVRHYGSRAAELVSVKPGLTGLWQVSGRSSVKYPQRAAMDLKLVRELTLKMYLSILLRTIWALVRGNGAW